MATKSHATIHNVKGEQLPVAWAKILGLDIDKDAQQLVDVTLKLIGQPAGKKASFEQIEQTVKRLQAVPVINPDFTEESLYDENGLPK